MREEDESNIRGGETDMDLYAPVDSLVIPFRVRTISKGRHDFCGTYKGYTINIERDHPSQNWYIIVTAPSGGYVYDGWWRESEGKPLREAIYEALRGSMLLG